MSENEKDINENRDLVVGVDMNDDRVEVEQMLMVENDANDDQTLSQINTRETECGWWYFRGTYLQRFANKRVLVVYFGLSACLVSATFSYLNATITTLEKRFKIPSRTSGIISTSNEYSLLITSILVGHYAGYRWHKPRCMAIGYSLFILYAFLNVLPHFLYGSSTDALSLTVEHGMTAANVSTAFVSNELRKKLCNADGHSYAECEAGDQSYIPQVILIAAQLVAGVGMGLTEVLAITYMDDNIKKTETASLISLQFFFRMLGPSFGYTLASICLRLYITPSLTPTITNIDPRWMGAWWIGWLVFGFLLIVLAVVTAMLPRRLPETVATMTQAERVQLTSDSMNRASLTATLATCKRLLTNHVMVFTNLATIFFVCGMIPFHIFATKYIETQFRQSASTANFVTGNVSLIFSALGILISGFVISKLKPSARQMAAWNVFVGLTAGIGAIVFTQLGCDAVDQSMIISKYPSVNLSNNLVACNAQCSCEFVKYSPVCGENNFTYISACHAGCQMSNRDDNNDIEIFQNCSCIQSAMPIHEYTIAAASDPRAFGGNATSGPCDVDCKLQFIIFIIIMSIVNFFGATGRTSNFLIYLRCVDERDKAASLAFGSAAISIFAAIPMPILFGTIIDRFCILWGRTCTTEGNCWIYESKSLRIWMNGIIALLIFVGCFCDFLVWYFVDEMDLYDEVQSFGTVLQKRREERKLRKLLAIQNGTKK